MRLHLKRNRLFYISFFCAIILSIIFGVIVVISNDSYLNLLISSNKNLYSLINVSASLIDVFWKVFFKFFYPLLFVFILGINYYLCLFSYIIVGYQFSIFFMTIFALIDIYKFSGFLICLFIIIPLNFIFFGLLIYFSVINLERSLTSYKNKYFKEGYDKNYFINVLLVFLMLTIISFIISIILIFSLKKCNIFYFLIKNCVFLHKKPINY